MTEKYTFIKKETKDFGDTLRIYWQLEDKTRTIPCTEAEKLIYGVEFKANNTLYKPQILESKFTDSKDKYYSIYNGFGGISCLNVFKSLKKAQEAAIIDYEKDKECYISMNRNSN
jgi:hypothetical protein